jgi:hypothetical protein
MRQVSRLACTDFEERWLHLSTASVSDAAEKRAGNPVAEMIAAIGTSISSLAHVTGRGQTRRAARHST